MSDFFIGRQPILDRNLKLYAYELLFRNGNKNYHPGETDDDTATSQVIITAFTEIGLDKLVKDKLTFVNIPYKFITNPELLPMEPEQVVLEILENVVIDRHSIEGIKAISERGFTLALDDFVYSDKYDSILPFIDIVKLDITQFEREEWSKQINNLRSFGCKILAEKVESEDEFEYLKSMNVDYFQGYFFAKPKVISGKTIASSKVFLARMLSKLNDPDTDIDELQDLIGKDVGISVKSLNYANSAYNGLNRKLESIREAIIYLGRDTIKGWVTLLMMANVDEKPEELMTMALVRAKFCELLAKSTRLEGADAFFTVGLFSILDSLLDAPLESILEKMSITPEMQDALVNHTGDKGKALRYAMDLEFGFAEGFEFRGLDEYQISDIHLDAIRWTDTSMLELGI